MIENIGMLNQLQQNGDFYKDISANVNKWFDTSNFNKSDNRPLEIGKNKKNLVNLKVSLVVK